MFMKVYSHYVMNYNRSLQTKLDLLQTNPRFAEFMKVRVCLFVCMCACV